MGTIISLSHIYPLTPLAAGALASLSEMAPILRVRHVAIYRRQCDALRVVLKFSGDVEA